MKKWARRILKFSAAVLFLLLFAAVLLMLYSEWHGVPVVAKAYLERELAHRGVPIKIGYLGATAFGGVTMRNVRIYYDDAKTQPFLLAEKIHIDADPRSLLRRSPDIKALTVNAAEILLPHEYPPLMREKLRVQHADFQVQLEPQRLNLTSFRAVVGGMTMRLSGTVRDLDSRHREPAELRPEKDAENVLTPLARRLLTLQPQIHKVYHLLKAQNLGQGNIDLHFDLPLAKITDFSCRGKFLLPNPTIHDTVAQKLQGQMVFSNGILRFDALTMAIGHEDVIRGDAVIDLDQQLLSADLKGQLQVNTAMALIGRDRPAILRPLQLTAPIDFAMALQLSNWQVDTLAGTMSFTVRNGSYRDLDFDQLEGTLEYEDKSLTCQDLHISRHNGAEELRGNVFLGFDPERMEVDLNGRLDPLEWLPGLGLTIPKAMAEMQWLQQLPEITISLHNSALDWRQWRGQGQVTTGGLAWRKLTVDNLTSAFVFAPRHLAFTELTASWSGAEEGKLTASIDITKAEEQSLFHADIDTEIATAAETYAAAAQFSFDLQTGQITGTTSGTSDLKAVYLALYEALHLPELPILEDISYTAPPDLSLTGRFNVKQPESWTVEGTVSAHDISYDSRSFVAAACRLALSAERLVFTDITAESADGTLLEGGVEIQWDPFVLQLSGTLEGTPETIDVFIRSRRPQEIYRQIWQDFSWHDESPPQVDIKDFRFAFNPRDRNWRLTMDSHVTAARAEYKGLQTGFLELDVALDLPRRLEVNNIKVQWHEDKEAEADVHIRLEGQPACHFSIAAVADPRQILHLINPTWQPFGDVQFADDAKMTCHGSFDIRPQALPQLQGVIQSTVLKYGNLEFENAAIEWSLQNNRLALPSISANLHNGQVDASAYFDLTTKSGFCALTVANIDLRPLLLDLGAVEAPAEAVGKLSGSCQIQILKNWANRPLQLNGNGNLLLTDGNLWQVPLLEQLGKLLDVTFLSRLSGGKLSGLGRISELQADLEFKGNRVNVAKLTTDGTIVSLEGQGQYFWDAGKINFQVEGQAFRKVRVFWFFMKPFSWVFNAELTGTLQDYRWQLLSKLGRILSGRPPAEEDIGG